MSRIGRKPVPVPSGVTVTINGIVQNGYTTDYQNSTVTFDIVPLPSDQIIIKYVVEE